MSAYTWIVTRDAILGDESDAIGKLGPPGVEDHEPFDKVIMQGEHFRMLGADADIRHSGYILGQYDGREPLDDYGRGQQCAQIEYERGGHWISLQKFRAVR